MSYGYPVSCFLRPKGLMNLLASTGLLDGRATFLAFLGIGIQPVCSFRVVCAFLLPLLDDFTENRSMGIGITATETQLALAFALDNRDDLVQHPCWSLGAFDNIFAVPVRAPTEVRGVRDERRVEQGVIPIISLVLTAARSYSLFGDLWADKSVNDFTLDDPITSALHTLYLARLPILSDFTSQVLCPTIYTKSVLAAHGHGHLVHLFPREFTAADWTFEGTTGQTSGRGLASFDGG